MGITIHHSLSQRKDCVKKTLDRTEQLAKSFQQRAKILDIPFNINRKSDYSLYIDIGGCETLAFQFQSKNEIIAEKEKTGYCYLYNILTDNKKKEIDNGYEIENYPQNEIYFCSDFCKTQFAKSISEHRFVAELIRQTASYCLTSNVNDEGDYYNTGEIEDAKQAIYRNGKMVVILTEILQKMRRS
jgi:hypothetical protein